jgi:histone H3/H4
MDAGAHKLLETVVLKTLHAHSFTRSSSQASLVLSDLLSRYLILLATTCSKYAQHTGRVNMTVRDAVHALDELGVSMDELHEYCGTEGDELARYSGHSTKRQEDLGELRGQSECDNLIFSY